MSPHAAAQPAWFRRLHQETFRRGGKAFPPVLRPPSTRAARPRPSAVLMLFGESAPDAGDAHVLLTERAHSLRTHPGEMSFPGGRIDPGDTGPSAAALREAQEETGAEPAGIEVVEEFPALSLPVSNTEVTPVLAWWREPSPVTVVDQGEVASVHLVPLARLLDPANRLMISIPGRPSHPAFEFGDLLIWGFTAGILDRLLHLSGLERPWDRSRVEPVPAAVSPQLAATDQNGALR